MKMLHFTTADVPEIRAECGCRLYRKGYKGMEIHVQFCSTCWTPFKLYEAVRDAALTYEEMEAV